MDPLQIEHLSDAGINFMRLADPPAVILILVFTFIIFRTIWIHKRYRMANLSLIALLISAPVTYLCSVSEEVLWGRRFFWRAVLQNGAVAIVFAFLILPRLYKRWPGLLEEAPLFLSDVEMREEKKITENQQRKEN